MLPEVIMPNGERWAYARCGDDYALHYTHPDAPAATMPITAEALHMLALAVSGVAFVDVVEA